MSEENNKKKFDKWDLSVSPFDYDIEQIKKSKSFPLSCIPEKGFLHEYLKYACKTSDAPLPFGFFVGMSILATSSSGVFYQFGYQRKKLNMYMILTAPTAHYRKSTATGLGRYILGMTTAEKGKGIIYPDDFTLEKLLHIILDQKVGSFFFDEWSGVMCMMQKSYSLGIKQFFTSMWDNGNYIRRIKSEEITIEGAYLNICSSTTIDWMESTVSSEDLNGGFLNRFIYIFIKEKTRFWDFPPFKGNPCEEIVLRDYLVEAQQNKKELVLSEEAENNYREFYIKFEEEFEKKDSDTKNLYVRLPAYCLKFACLYQINEDTKKTIISGENMEKAVELTKWILDCSYEETSERFLTDNNYKTNRLVFNRIKKAGKEGMDRSKLYQLSHLQSRQLDEQLKTLLASDEIRSEEILNEETNRKQIRYFIN